MDEPQTAERNQAPTADPSEQRSGRAVSTVAALEHLSGPTCGSVVWLAPMPLDVVIGADGQMTVAPAQPPDVPDGLVARLFPTGDSFRIEAAEGSPLWVNGARLREVDLTHCDTIEFGERGPLSRFRVFREGRPQRKSVGDILSDEVAYLRSSRKPLVVRLARAVGEGLRQLAGQTTLLFRLTVILAIVALGVLAYQQHRLNTLLTERIERGTARIDSFADALTRARNESLTPKDLSALREELGQSLTSAAERLAALEQRSQAAVRVIAGSSPSVVFLQGAYGFRERDSGRMLRLVLDDLGRPLISPFGKPFLTLDGDGPIAERQMTGTGFVVGDQGAIVTNRHVALPWEGDTDVEGMAEQGLEPVMVRFLLYRPGEAESEPVEILRVSDETDLAVLRRTETDGPLPGLPLAETPPTPGAEVIVMGYPTGLRSMLAQSSEAFVKELEESGDTEFWLVARRLAEAGKIMPLSSRGIVAQAGGDAIVYDAETTHGGSGGPVLDARGRVVAVNSAILPEYGGSNLGVPVEKVAALLADAGVF